MLSIGPRSPTTSTPGTPHAMPAVHPHVSAPLRSHLRRRHGSYTQAVSRSEEPRYDIYETCAGMVKTAAAGPSSALSPLCGHLLYSQTHILIDCPSLTLDRAGLHLDLTVLIGQLHHAGRWGAHSNTYSSTARTYKSVVDSGPASGPRTTGCYVGGNSSTAPYRRVTALS